MFISRNNDYCKCMGATDFLIGIFNREGNNELVLYDIVV